LSDRTKLEQHRKQAVRRRLAVKGLSAGWETETEPRCNCGAPAVLVITFDSGERYFCATHFPREFVPKPSA
jgi:hypothetical protein